MNFSDWFGIWNADKLGLDNIINDWIESCYGYDRWWYVSGLPEKDYLEPGRLTNEIRLEIPLSQINN